MTSRGIAKGSAVLLRLGSFVDTSQLRMHITCEYGLGQVAALRHLHRSAKIAVKVSVRWPHQRDDSSILRHIDA